MPRNEGTTPVFPLDGGLADRLGGRMVPPNSAAALERVEVTRSSVEGGKGSRRVSSKGARGGCLRFGDERFEDGRGSYVLIGAQDRYRDLISTPTDHSWEFFIRFNKIPDSTSDTRTIVCFGAPYTTGLLSYELNYIKSVAGNINLQFSWGDATAGGIAQARAWAYEFRPDTWYAIRVTLDLNTPLEDEYELFVNNVSQGTLNNTISTVRTIQTVNAPIYVGGEGINSQGNGGEFEIQDLRLWAKKLAAANASVTRFASEVLIPSDHSDEAFLYGWWPMNDGAGRVVHDKSRWQNDGYMGPSAIVVTEGKKVGAGAVFIDGHTSFLQAHLEWFDAWRNEWQDQNFSDNTKYTVGISIRCALLDASVEGFSGRRAIIAELSGSEQRDRPVGQLAFDQTGVLYGTAYFNGAANSLVDTSQLLPGRMELLEYFIDTDSTSQAQELWRDGEKVQSAALLPGAGTAPDFPTHLRIGCASDFATDQQTPWSRLDAQNAKEGVPLLIEEVRLWVAALSDDEIVDRWEKVLSPAQILESLEVATAQFTKDSTSVTANGTPSTSFINSFLVPDGVEETTTEEDRDGKITQQKLHHISNISGAAVTLSNPYRGTTSGSLGVNVTRLGGYWRFGGPDELQSIVGLSDTLLWEDMATKPTPDDRGNKSANEGAGNSQIGNTVLAYDLSPVGVPLWYAVDPYSQDESPGRKLPRWHMGGYSQSGQSPIELVHAHRDLDGQPRNLVAHDGNLLELDDRWRADSPYENDTIGSLELHGEDAILVPDDPLLDMRQSGSTDWSTFQGWFKFIETDGKRVLFCKADDEDNINHIGYVESGRLKFAYENAGSGNLVETDLAPIEKDRWHFIEATRSLANFFLFIDGVSHSFTTTAIGAGGLVHPTTSEKQYIGWVPEKLRSEYKGFRGLITDLRYMAATTQNAEMHDSDYLPPSSRINSSGSLDEVYYYDLSEGAGWLINDYLDSLDAEFDCQPFRVLRGGIGKAGPDQSPSAINFDGRAYVCTGKGAPVVFDNKDGARRMGLVAPSYAPEYEYQQIDRWNNDAPGYSSGAGATDSVTHSVAFDEYHQINCAYGSSYGWDVQGLSDAAANDADSIAVDLWIQPSRLDKRMYLIGRGYGDETGNWWVELIPNDAGTGLRVRFAWYDLEAKAVKYFESTNYIIDDTTKWWYLWIGTEFGRASASRRDYIEYVGEASGVGSALNSATLQDSGDLDTDDKPMQGTMAITLGWTGFVGARDELNGFFGLVAEFRVTTDTDRDTTHPLGGGTPTVPTNSPTALMTATHGWTGTNSAEWQVVLVSNLNVGQGDDPGDSSSNNATIQLIWARTLPLIEGEYRVRVTFYDPATGWESNPSPEISLDVEERNEGKEALINWIQLSGIPISNDDRAEIHRRIYRTTANGSIFYLEQTIEDNKATTATLSKHGTALSQSAETLSLTNSHPPRWTAVATNGSRLFINRPGQSGVLYSEIGTSFLPCSIPAENAIATDTRRNGEVRALGALYGQIVAFLDEAVVTMDDLGGAFSSTTVETEGGALGAGAIVQAARRIYHLSDYGVYAYNGSTDPLVSAQIGKPDGTIGLIDRGYGAVHGVFWRERDQVIFLARKGGEKYPGMRLSVEVADPSRPRFLVAQTPQLTALGLAESFDGENQLWGGDRWGMIYELDRGTVDGPRDGYGTASGALASGSTTTNLVTGGTLDTKGDGHRGQRVRVVERNADGSIANEDVGVIRSNDGTDLVLEEALSFTPPENAEWEIGAYRRQWRSGHHPYDEEAADQKGFGDFRANMRQVAGSRVTLRSRVDFGTWYTDDEDPRGQDLGTYNKLKANLLRHVERGQLLQFEVESWDDMEMFDYQVGQRRSTHK